MRKNVSLLMFMIIVLFVSCRNSINGQFIEEDSKEKITPKILAEKCINNQIMLNNIGNGRAAISSEYPEFLNELNIVDENGNKISFSDYSEDEKKLFFKFWKEETGKHLEEKFIADESIYKMALLENTVIENTINTSFRNANTVNPDAFFKKYVKNMQKAINKEIKNERSSSSDSKLVDIDKCELVPASVEIFKENYHKGYILINSKSKEWDSSFYIGHASMMSEDIFQEEWEENKFAKTTITSFPDNNRKNKKTIWPDQTDGVQFEPLGYWCGNNAASNVSIFGVRKAWWSWFKWYSSPATEDEYDRAAEFAKKQEGLLYNYNYLAFGMWNTDYYYCSSLVFRAWYEISSDYKLTNNPVYITPSDIANSDRTQFITSYSNF